MKRSIILFLMLLVVTVFNRCVVFNEVTEIEGGNNIDQNFVLSDNQLVIKFDENTPEQRKIELRTMFPFKEPVEFCSCGSRDIEIWTINTDAINIEEAVSSLEREEESAGDVEGDRQFTFSVDRTRTLDTGGNQSAPGSLLSLDPNSINIAVIDTGINFDYFPEVPTEESKFLFETTSFSDCEDASGNREVSGWNFVDGNTDIQDSKSHGTYVSKIIGKKLNSEGISYRILPIKVFNREGISSYSNIVCALSYVKSIQNRGGNITIVNASFGVSIGSERNVNDFKVLKELIEELQNEVLVVTSAGNEGENTDAGGNTSHFPSGYDSSNIVGVAGYQIRERDTILHPNSNYGVMSIDLATQFEGYRLEIELPEVDRNERINLSGTSYAAAYISGLAAKLYSDNGRPNPQALKELIVESSSKVFSLRDSIQEGRVFIKE